MFEEGDLVVKLIRGAGSTTASIAEVFEVSDDEVKITEPDGHEANVHAYDPDTGEELPSTASIPGMTSQIVVLDGGEEDKIREGICDS